MRGTDWKPAAPQNGGRSSVSRRSFIRNPREDTELSRHKFGGIRMDGIIYLVGLIVIIMFVLSLFGLR